MRPIKQVMNTNIRGLALGAAALAIAAAGQPAAARAQGTLPPPQADGMPTQAQHDRASTDPNSFGAGWGDMPGGVAARPYVRTLTLINGGVETPVITAGTTTPHEPPVGGVTTAIAAGNLCRAGQPAGTGTCYATPNRVGLSVAYRAGDNNGSDFAAPSVPLTTRVDANTIIDMTVALNTLGRDLRWTSMNGDLLYWQTTNLGQDDATVRVKFKPAPAPTISSFAPGNGCTATPIRDCDIQRADGQTLSASMVFSLDDTLDDALTGAAFATQNAIFSFLQPGGTPQSPSLDIQVASSHERADGSPQLGSFKAFLPAAALLNLYGLLPGDATAFSTTRGGDAGTNDTPTYAPWNAAAHGSDGLLVTVEDITFSAPAYRVKSKLKPISTKASARRRKTTVTSTVAACAKRRKNCLATLYDLGPGDRARYRATRSTLLKNKAVKRKLSLTRPAAKLAKGDRYLLIVRSKKNKKLLASAVGSVR